MKKRRVIVTFEVTTTLTSKELKNKGVASSFFCCGEAEVHQVQVNVIKVKAKKKGKG